MGRCLIVLASCCLLVAPVFAADCTESVKAAFVKQHEHKTYRVSMSQPTAEGPVQMTIDYVLPDKMLQTVVAPHMPGEQQTMLVGDRAFAGTSGAFEELLPHLVQSVISEFRVATSPETQNLGSFECLGKQAFEGKEFVAYRASDKPASNPDDTLARTIYVDEASGLPAYNVIAAVTGKAEPVLKVVYSYPTDIEIVAPAGAPVQSPRH